MRSRLEREERNEERMANAVLSQTGKQMGTSDVSLPWETHASKQASVIIFPPDTPEEPVYTRPSETHAGIEGESLVKRKGLSGL